MANSKLRRLLAYGKSFNCADVKTARWRGPAKISGVDEEGVALKCQPQTFKVARKCVRKKVEAQDVDAVERESESVPSRTWDKVPWHEHDRDPR